VRSALAIDFHKPGSVLAFFEQRRAIPSQIVEMKTMMDLEAVLRRVRAEFVEMPGLRLTPAQATRLWELDGPACHAVIEALVESSFLRWTASGAVTRADN
jgi:hypothetical protein